MKNYRLKYRNAEKRWKKAINQYFKESGKLITSDTYTEIMFVKDPNNEHCLIFNPELPKYLTSANSNFEDADDNLICWKQNKRNRKQRSKDYIKRVNMLKHENLNEKEFKEEKRNLWFTWMKK